MTFPIKEPSDNVQNKGFENISVEMDKGQNIDNFARTDGVPVLVVHNAKKFYKKGIPVLENFNMTVQRGEIFSLLGSSGCGKSTAISCIVGVAKLNAGQVYVFGCKPGVRGKLVGYMPQETSLYGEFSIAETLLYFGTLSGMTAEAIKRKIIFLSKLLKLPDSSQRVDTLSGGYKRRVSLAISLVHDPELLILDEPTVGVDPLLREHIWKYLVQLSTKEGKTVLITTHYTNEAKDSTKVGLMRSGRLLVEQDPASLLELFNATSLETVVLQLCRADAARHNQHYKNSENEICKKLELDASTLNTHLPHCNKLIPSTYYGPKNEEIHDSVKRIQSLIEKKFVVVFRRLILLLCTVLVPAVNTGLICVTFKNDPRNLGFGVINMEVPNFTQCLNVPARIPGVCDVANFSCKYLKHIHLDVVTLKGFETEEEAISEVEKGSIWGYFMFPKNFSNSGYERFKSGAYIDETMFNQSEIIVKMDQTSTFIMYVVIKNFLTGLQDFAMTVLEDCGYDKRLAKFALDYKTPVFGSEEIKFVEFVAPSVAIICMYFFPIIGSSIGYIKEKKLGTYNRSLVAGMKTWEFVFAYVSSECIVVLLQSFLVYIVLTSLVGIEILGSSVLAALLVVMTGFTGVSMGLMIGSICNEEIEAAILAIAIFFPNIFVCGIIWPVEGMPLLLQRISLAMPCTLPGEAIRSIFSRGWSFSHPNVWPGFVVVLGYMLVFCLLTVHVQKLKQK